MTHTFEGQEVHTFGDVFRIMQDIAKAGDKDRAKAFIDSYVHNLTTEHGKSRDTAIHIVKQNIGYGAGYYDRATAEKVWETFDVEHPMFGRKYPTPEEAFNAGRDAA